MSDKITVDEWRSEMESLYKPMTRAEGWISVTEFAAGVGRCRQAAKRLLEAGVLAGRYETAEGPYANTDGRITNHTLYRRKRKGRP